MAKRSKSGAAQPSGDLRSWFPDTDLRKAWAVIVYRQVLDSLQALEGLDQESAGYVVTRLEQVLHKGGPALREWIRD